MPKLCLVDACDQEIVIRKHGMCRSHYNRWHRTGQTSCEAERPKTCTQCGTTFQSQQPNAKTCSEACKAGAVRARARQRYVPRTPTTAICAECSAEFLSNMASRMYCTRACSRKAREARQAVLCVTDGCCKPVKAKSLCNTHYNQTLPNRHKKIAVPCARCGKPALKEQQKRYALRYCGDVCKNLHRTEQARLRNSQVEVWKPRPLWHTAHLAYPKQAVTSRVWVAARCITCRREFLDLFGSKACGAECQRAHHGAVRRETDHRRRARKVAAFVAPVYRQRIFEQDNFTCQLCLNPMEMDKRVPHPRSPTIDHIIPIARGGAHAPYNVQSACFLCNATKGDREWHTPD